MQRITINNGTLKVDVNPIGAEFFSIKNLRNGRECLWQGNPEIWKSRSPVLFPIVGGLYNTTMRHEGKVYSMTQHGFARASEFEVVSHTDSEVLLRLLSSDATHEKYPFDFIFEIGYKLSGDTIEVSYKVSNPSDKTIYFQLGAHPGLNHIDFDPSTEVQGYLSFDDPKGCGAITSGAINGSGMLIDTVKVLPLDEGLIAVDKDIFNDGALILEHTQANEICMLDRDKTPYVKVTFDAPVVGIWANSNGSHAPYLCIEPWYGRCDRDGYIGEFANKDWMQSLNAGNSFTASYTITITK